MILRVWQNVGVTAKYYHVTTIFYIFRYHNIFAPFTSETILYNKNLIVGCTMFIKYAVRPENRFSFFRMVSDKSGFMIFTVSLWHSYVFDLPFKNDTSLGKKTIPIDFRLMGTT